MAKKSKSDINFEDALRELEDITRALEGGSLSLDESIKAYEKGMELRKLCAGMLGEAEKKLQMLEEKSSGQVEVRDLDSEGTNGENPDTAQGGLFAPPES